METDAAAVRELYRFAARVKSQMATGEEEEEKEEEEEEEELEEEEHNEYFRGCHPSSMAEHQYRRRRRCI